MDQAKFNHIDMRLSHYIRQSALNRSKTPVIASKSQGKVNVLPIVQTIRKRSGKVQK